MRGTDFQQSAMTAFHGLGQNRATEFSGRGCRNRAIEEDPDMTTIT